MPTVRPTEIEFCLSDGDVVTEVFADSRDALLADLRSSHFDHGFDSIEKSVHVMYTVWPACTGACVDCSCEDQDSTVCVTVHPVVPECTETDHDWQAPHHLVGGLKENPGVFGKGGSVTEQEACVHCGCGRFTDHWDTASYDGSQGHTAISYTEEEYDVAPEQGE